MTIERRNQIIDNLKDKESRDFFVEEFINTSIPFQIRAIRQSLGKTQKQLADDLSTGQSRVSQLENPDYGNLTLNTLKKLASIFDVALIVKFAPFSELVDLFDRWSPEKIAVATYAGDVRLHGSSALFRSESSIDHLRIETETTPLIASDRTSRTFFSFEPEWEGTYARIETESLVGKEGTAGIG